MDTTVLAGHMLALHIASKVLQDAPDATFLSQAHEQGLFSEWPIQPRSGEGASALEALKRMFQTKQGDAAAIRQDHMALFSGPTPIARPWESVWREREKLLFGEQTMLVRNAYVQWGIVNQEYGQEPEDHLGLELAFCVFLLDKMLNRNDETAAAALRAFLDDHVLQWAEPCLREASENASEEFYRHMPLLSLDAVNSLREALGPEKKPE